MEIEDDKSIDYKLDCILKQLAQLTLSISEMATSNVQGVEETSEDVKTNTNEVGSKIMNLVESFKDTIMGKVTEIVSFLNPGERVKDWTNKAKFLGFGQK